MTYNKYDDAGVMTDTAALSLLQQAATAIDSASVTAAPAENHLGRIADVGAMIDTGDYSDAIRALGELRTLRIRLDALALRLTAIAESQVTS